MTAVRMMKPPARISAVARGCDQARRRRRPIDQDRAEADQLIERGEPRREDEGGGEMPVALKKEEDRDRAGERQDDRAAVEGGKLDRRVRGARKQAVDRRGARDLVRTIRPSANPITLARPIWMRPAASMVRAAATAISPVAEIIVKRVASKA